VKKSPWAILTVFVSVAAIMLWALFSKPNHDLEAVGKTEVVEEQISVEPNVAKNSAVVKKALLEVEELDEFNPYENEVLKAQLQQVSDVYAENIKYPIGSQPIYNPEDAREYKEFEQSEVDLPFPEKDGDANPIRISAATNTFQYFEGDSIAVRARRHIYSSCWCYLR